MASQLQHMGCTIQATSFGLGNSLCCGLFHCLYPTRLTRRVLVLPILIEDVVDSKIAKRFMNYFFAITLILISATILINWFIDPYGAFENSPKIEKLNKVKVTTSRQGRLFRALEIARIKPTAVFFGSSRVKAGLNPDYFKDKADLIAYNAAFDGANIDEIYYYLEHTLYHQPNLKLVVLGIDFFSFGEHNKIKSDFSPDYLKGGTLNIPHHFYLLVSKTSLKNSMQTIKENAFSDPLPPYLEGGMYNPVLAANAPTEFFNQNDISFLKYAMNAKDYYNNYAVDRGKIERFKQLVELCSQKNIELKVFFNPSKAVYWELFNRVDLWPVLEGLKRELAAIHPIWDFSGFNCVTTQAIEKEEDPFYFECSHFRPVVGNLIFDRFFGHPNAIESFGYLLTPETVEASLIKIRADRDKWLQSQPSGLADLDAAFPLRACKTIKKV